MANLEGDLPLYPVLIATNITLEITPLSRLPVHGLLSVLFLKQVTHPFARGAT